MVSDIVYPLRQGGLAGGAYEELRHSLRSLPGGHEVWLVGGKPAWAAGVNHIRVQQSGGKYQNVRKILRAACSSSLVSDPFLLFNDDFFVLDPTLPLLHGGPFEAYVKRLSNSYARGGRETLKILRAQGYADPLSWSLHTPLVVHKEPMRAALALAGNSPYAIHVRTLYGALAGLEGTQHRDVKIHAQGLPEPTWPYVSTSDEAWQRHKIGAWIRERFQTPSRYER